MHINKDKKTPMTHAHNNLPPATPHPGLEQYSGDQIGAAFLALQEGAFAGIRADEEAGAITAEEAAHRLRVAELAGSAIFNLSNSIQTGEGLRELLRNRARTIENPPTNQPVDRHFKSPIVRRDVARQLRMAAEMGVDELFGGQTKQETEASAPTQKTTLNTPLPRAEQVDKAERNRLIDGFIAAAGNTLSAYSDGPGGLQGNGPNGRAHNNIYGMLHDRVRSMPEVKAASRPDTDPLDVPVETFTIAPQQTSETVMRKKKQIKYKRFTGKAQEFEVDAPSTVEVDERDPVTGERLVLVNYDFNPRFAGDLNNYFRAEGSASANKDATNIPAYREFGGTRLGGHLSFGMTLPESTAKQLQAEAMKDPRFLRDMADRIFTEASNGPAGRYGAEQMRDYYHKGSPRSGNPLRPPYQKIDEQLPKWNVWMFDATNVHRDIDTLRALGHLDTASENDHQRFDDPANPAHVTKLPVVRH